MDLWCSLCMHQEARRMAVTVTRGWALCLSHATFDIRIHRPDLGEATFLVHLQKVADEADC